MLRAGVVDRVVWFLAPILIGGREAPGAIADPGVAALADAPRLIDRRVEAIGDDVVVSGRLRPLGAAVG